MISPEKQLVEILRGTDEVLEEKELLAKLVKSYTEGKPLRIKFGADPSRPDLHLGHTVVINKLRTFQELGHEILFIIGDFTARIGDPTGRSKTRPEISLEEVQAYAKTYQTQIFKVLDPAKTQVVYNGDWLDRLTPTEFIQLMASRTLQQLLAREDFSSRFSQQQPIFMHEFAYPLLQAYDSVHLRADVELGGTDQKFNLLLGRELQRQHGQRPQTVLMMPLLEGLDGIQKMSKSYDNYIGVTEPAKDMFGKVMSISDTLMVRYYELLSATSTENLAQLKANLLSGAQHPMEAKKQLAQEITARFWGTEAAQAERAYFDATFSKKQTPDEMDTHTVCLDAERRLDILDFVVARGFAPSKGEARRALKQNGIKIDDLPLTAEKVPLQSGQTYILRYGKLKWSRIIVG